MNKEIIEALYDLATDYDEDSYTTNKTKNEIKKNMEELNEDKSYKKSNS